MTPSYRDLNQLPPIHTPTNGSVSWVKTQWTSAIRLRKIGLYNPTFFNTRRCRSRGHTGTDTGGFDLYLTVPAVFHNRLSPGPDSSRMGVGKNFYDNLRQMTILYKS